MTTRLTVNQAEALQAVIKGRVQGMMLNKTVPSLIKRGLMVKSVEEQHGGFVPRAFGGPGGVRRVTVYRLTPAGLEAYEDMRTKWYQAKLAQVETEYGQDMSTARSRTVK